MNTKSVGLLFVVLAIINIFIAYAMWEEIKPGKAEPSHIIENSISLEEAALSVVTVGERISHNSIYFHQWEALNSKERDNALANEQIFLLSVDEFQNEANASFIQDLIEKKKTVLFYGYRIDAEKIITSSTFRIPFYPMSASKKIYYYAYGVEYSTQHDEFIPVAIMGNFSEAEMPDKIGQFLLKHYLSE